MLMQGLRRYGFKQKADSIARDILELPMRFGFYEYYDSFNGRAYGSKDFSWTASLFIDTAYENYIKADKVSAVLRKDKLLNEESEPSGISGIRISQEMLRSVRILQAKYYTDQGTVDYESIKLSDKYRDYKKIAASLRDFDLSLLKEEQDKLAFWINLYNTIVVDGIIENNVSESVKEVGGFFSKIKYLIGGQSFSPDDIEHGILRKNRLKPNRPWKQFGLFNPKKKFMIKHIDSRIHFALVCGSRSCAPIKYYTPENIDRDLEMATRNFINSSEVIVIPEENRMLVSQIFKWYKSDFCGKSGVLKLIKKYILDDDKRDYLDNNRNVKIDYLYYDWNLNK
jgi:hypothetical protein